jgi:hypothetical protein
MRRGIVGCHGADSGLDVGGQRVGCIEDALRHSGDLGSAAGMAGWAVIENSNMDGALSASAADYVLRSGDSTNTPSSTESAPRSSRSRWSSAPTGGQPANAAGVCTGEPAVMCSSPTRFDSFNYSG